jgi:hypothetical protein
MNITELLVIANLVLIVGGVIGGYIVIKSAIANSERLIGERVRAALVAENDLLQSKVDRMSGELKEAKTMMQFLLDTLKRERGLEIRVEDDRITLRESGQTTIVHLPRSRSGVLQTNDDDTKPHKAIK